MTVNAMCPPLWGETITRGLGIALISAALKHFLSISTLKQELCKYMFEEGNGTPLQYSCLENPMDGGAW